MLDVREGFILKQEDQYIGEPEEVSNELVFLPTTDINHACVFETPEAVDAFHREFGWQDFKPIAVRKTTKIERFPMPSRPNNEKLN